MTGASTLRHKANVRAMVASAPTLFRSPARESAMPFCMSMMMRAGVDMLFVRSNEVAKKLYSFVNLLWMTNVDLAKRAVFNYRGLGKGSRTLENDPSMRCEEFFYSLNEVVKKPDSFVNL